jgi:pimeloyl-ACP methyl ester carboxylesterase
MDPLSVELAIPFSRFIMASMKREVLSKMKKICLFLFIGVLTVLFGCQGIQKNAAPSVSEGYVTVDEGVDLRYKTVGDGPEAVLIPAAIYLEYEFEKLADKSRTLIFYDQRGRGKSSPVTDKSQINMDIEISDLEALRRHFGKEKVSLIGWSYLGGMVILYADRYPEHINRVIQIGPISPTYDLYMKSTVVPMDKVDAVKLKQMSEEKLAETDPEFYRT